MKFKELSSHPLPALTKEMKSRAKGARDQGEWIWNKDELYVADIIDGVLAVTIFRKKGKKIEAEFRHFYDKENYATQRISDNNRLSGSIDTYITRWSSTPLDKSSDNIISEYIPDAFEQSVYRLNPIEAIWKVEEKIKDSKRDSKYRKIKDKIDERMKCFSDPPAEFYNWIRNELMPAYFFYKHQKGTKQKGYCSSCKRKLTLSNIAHKEKIKCPKCGREIVCYNINKNRNDYIRDESYAIYTDHVIDEGEKAVAERTFNIYQRIEGFKAGDKKFKVECNIYEDLRTFYTLDPKEGLKFKPSADGQGLYVHGSFCNTSDIRWCRYCDYRGNMGTSIGYIYPYNFNELINQIQGLENIDAAVVVAHAKCDLIGIIKAFKREPVIENLAKHGKYNLLYYAIYLFKSNMNKYINRNEKSPSKYLGIDKVTFKEMGDLDVHTYCLYKSFEKNYKVDIPLVRQYTSNGIRSSEVLITLLSVNNIEPRKFITYLEKQSKLLHMKVKAVYELYRDYSDMVSDIKMSRTESVVFPRDLQQEHDRVAQIQTDLKYDKENKLLHKRGEILHMLDYSNNNFRIVAFDKADDFLNESAKLSHCVKTYISRCSKGETNIYGIRRADAPDEPYYTLTLSNNAAVTMNLGKHNCQPTDEVKAFVREWQSKCIRKHKKEFIKAIKAMKTA